MLESKKQRNVRAMPESTTTSLVNKASTSAAKVLGIAELREMILFELTTILQQKSKSLEPVCTFSKLRSINKDFDITITGSSEEGGSLKIQKLLRYSTEPDRYGIPAPLHWLFSGLLGIGIWRTYPFHRPRHLRLRLRQIDANVWSKESIRAGDLQGNEKAMWRQVRIGRPVDEPREVAIEMVFRSGATLYETCETPRLYETGIYFTTADDLGAVFDRLAKAWKRAQEAT